MRYSRYRARDAVHNYRDTLDHCSSMARGIERLIRKDSRIFLDQMKSLRAVKRRQNNNRHQPLNQGNQY